MMVFVVGCTAEQWDRVISRLPSPESGPSSQEQSPEQPPAGTPLPPAPPPGTPPTPEAVCFGLVQDRIAWDYTGSRRWNPTNVRRLCRGTSSGPEPATCFNRVIAWGCQLGRGNPLELAKRYQSL